MKKLFLLFLLLPAVAFSQKSPASNSKATKTVTAICFISSLQPGVDSIGLYELGGMGNRLISRGGRRMPDSAFVVVVPTGKSRFYGIGATPNSVARVILGEEPEVKLYANAEYMDKARTFGSAANTAHEKLNKELLYLSQQTEKIAQTNTDPKSAAALKTRKSRLLDSLKTANPLLWRTAGLYLYPDYVASSGDNYASRSAFLMDNYFANVDLSDPAYESVPAVFDAFVNYTTTVLASKRPNEVLDAALQKQLAKLPAESKTYRMALGGVVSTLKSAGSSLYMNYAKQYINRYRSNDYGEVSLMDMELKRSGTSTPGFEAPELEGLTPDSSTYALSKLRGKVVLIDFWASWCGPCRRENPNVVANYNKYKSKGFEILGVSLDRDVNAWRKAIKDDGLIWYHISDLRGWQSAHAQLYSVSSIPQTVLVDREGKIIARNIRGEQLGQKLEELLGK